MCPAHEPLVIEIGPGKGALTRKLLERADRVVAIELDSDLAASLRSKHDSSRLEIVEADVLDVDLARWGPAVIAGNLPYYITSPILNKVLGLSPTISRAVFLVQKEVAERLTAAPGSRDYGYLTVVTGVFSTPRYLMSVPPGAFHPAPKVDSAVVQLDLKTPSPGDDDFLEFASRCFRHKRKTLRNNLVARYPAVAGQAESGLRAEQLSIGQLRDLYARVQYNKDGR